MRYSLYFSIAACVFTDGGYIGVGGQPDLGALGELALLLKLACVSWCVKWVMFTYWII